MGERAHGGDDPEGDLVDLRDRLGGAAARTLVDALGRGS